MAAAWVTWISETSNSVTGGRSGGPLFSLDLRASLPPGAKLIGTNAWAGTLARSPERLSKLVLVDQMPFITANPTRSPDEKRDAEAILDAAALYDLYNRLTGPDAAKTTEGFVGAMITKAMPADEKKWIIQQNFKLPRRHAADLLYNHATQDWRDVIPRVKIPTLQ
jgi:hypothetical protein